MYMPVPGVSDAAGGQQPRETGFHIHMFLKVLLDNGFFCIKMVLKRTKMIAI